MALWDYLIVGGDSQIGTGIAKLLENAGEKVLKTTRRKHSATVNALHLDFADDISRWEPPPDIHTVFLCAAVTSIEQCRLNPGKTKKINVENTLKIAAKLSENNAKIIYPSTNLVFDGQILYQKAGDSPNPRTEYGRQKAEVERGILGLSENHSIVRLTKVINNRMPLLINWIKDLTSRIPIFPFSDMVISPIPLDFASNALVKTAKNQKSGIWQVSGKNDVTYEQIARHIARKLGVSQDYVKPIKTIDSEFEFESVPKHTTLDASRIEKELGLIGPDIWETIDRLFADKYETGR